MDAVVFRTKDFILKEQVVGPGLWEILPKIAKYCSIARNGQDRLIYFVDVGTEGKWG